MNRVYYDVALTLIGNNIKTSVETHWAVLPDHVIRALIRQHAQRDWGKALIKVDIYRRTP